MLHPVHSFWEIIENEHYSACNRIQERAISWLCHIGKCQSEQLIELYFRHKITFFSEYTQARRQKQSAIPTVDLCCIGVCHGLLTVAFVIPFKLSCAAINPRAMDDVASISLNSSRVIRGKNYSSDISW